jgi:ribosomal protein S18 acetylase RimI-like enzyme
MTCEGQIQLRHPTPQDAAGIATVHVRSWRAAYRGQLPQAYLEGLSISAREASWRRRVEMAPPTEQPFWVAEVDGRIVGFVATGPSRDDDAPSGTAEVYALYVDPDCWEKGIGTGLLDHAVRDLRRHDYREATLWCLSTNQQARSFYERAKWRFDGATKRESLGGTETEEVRYRLPLGTSPLPAVR